jgi:hypothetical protein
MAAKAARSESQTEAILGEASRGDVSPLEIARSLAVVFGGSAALDAMAAASLVCTVRSLTRGDVPKPRHLTGVASTIAYAALIRPWMAKRHEVDIDAAPEQVWPWLAQIGQDRGGFYSYEWLENLAGCEMHNADRIHPDWQHRDIGETVYLAPGYGMPVTHFEPGRSLALKGWGSFDVEPLDAGRSRLVCRSERKRGVGGAFYMLFVEIPHFVMERKMLVEIRRLVETPRLEPAEPFL